MISRIFFILGVGGAGKTTLVNKLKNKLPKFWVHDFDEVGVPANVDEKWRHETTNYWLGKIQDKGKKIILCGFLVPSEIEKQPNFNPQLNINYAFLKISPEIIRERLVKRNWEENKIKYHIEWADKLEKEIKNKKEQFIVSGDKNNPEQVVEIFERWIKEKTKLEMGYNKNSKSLL